MKVDALRDVIAHYCGLGARVIDWARRRVLGGEQVPTAEKIHVAPSLMHHRRVFRRAPQLYGADRGFFSERNAMVCVRGGVGTECILRLGGSKTPRRQAYERSAPFKRSPRGKVMPSSSVQRAASHYQPSHFAAQTS